MRSNKILSVQNRKSWMSTFRNISSRVKSFRSEWLLSKRSTYPCNIPMFSVNSSAFSYYHLLGCFNNCFFGKRLYSFVATYFPFGITTGFWAVTIFLKKILLFDNTQPITNENLLTLLRYSVFVSAQYLC